MMYLFSYGSNNTAQLSDRLSHPVVTLPAYLPGWQRVFRGHSRTWGGGVASLAKKRGAVTYGLACQVSEADLARMDRYEGVPFAYQRHRVKIVIGETPTSAIAYIAVSRTFEPPSRSYLESVARTISEHWSGDHGRVTPEEIPIR